MLLTLGTQCGLLGGMEEAVGLMLWLLGRCLQNVEVGRITMTSTAGTGMAEITLQPYRRVSQTWK